MLGNNTNKISSAQANYTIRTIDDRLRYSAYSYVKNRGHAETINSKTGYSRNKDKEISFALTLPASKQTDQ